jgi:hypothetical protein
MKSLSAIAALETRLLSFRVNQQLQERKGCTEHRQALMALRAKLMNPAHNAFTAFP